MTTYHPSEPESANGKANKDGKLTYISQYAIKHQRSKSSVKTRINNLNIERSPRLLEIRADTEIKQNINEIMTARTPGERNK